MNAELPAALRAALDAQLEGVSRRDLAGRAQQVSAHYRQGGGSAAVVQGSADALAYALTRLPATYAAMRAVLGEAARAAPGFAPQSLLDAGAGPGGAGWAALEVWPQIDEAALLDHNRSFLALAGQLAAQGPPALAGARRVSGDLAAPDPPAADLVVVGYALAELAPAAQVRAVEALWGAAQRMLALVEPGTPAGFARLREARERLVAAGARIAAPCPHEAACPLVGEDWCHFAQRLPRSRDHRLAKGADAPFEDEKFAYLVAVRPQVELAPRAARILAPPRAGKPGVDLKLCTPAGLERRRVARRDKPAFTALRRLGWGDRLE
ncbi:MAG: small ribosomal subunit Rsm22 family protein [Phenylobacterium sp.]